MNKIIMIKRVICVTLFIFLSSGAFCESPVMQAYLERFVRADLFGKVDILHEASRNYELNSQTGYAHSLYEYALQFVADNYAQIDDLCDMNTIAGLSINGLINEKNANHITDSDIYGILNVLWKLFLSYPDSKTRADTVIALSIIGKGNASLINNINNFLTEQNALFRSGEAVDYLVVSACISALMELGSSSSYPVLFSIITSGYPEVISSESYGALEIIPGALQQFLLNVIENNPPDEKYAAFRAVMNSQRLTIPERGQLAEAALAQSLLASEENVDLSVIRYASVVMLTGLRWTRANNLAIRHYYQVQADYQHEIIPKERFLEAIACLGAVGNSDAALVLCLQLGLINIRTETQGVFDADITLAIVKSLGLIGDNAAFNHLSYITNLPYTDEIIAQAREAVNRLKW